MALQAVRNNRRNNAALATKGSDLDLNYVVDLRFTTLVLEPPGTIAAVSETVRITSERILHAS
jgi:hypothetical protein